jgi:hypothetical protein
VWVFDVSDPANPVQSAFLPYRLDVSDGGVAISGQYAFVSAHGVHVLDLADPAHPVEVGYYPGSVTEIAARGNLAYLGADREGLEIIRFIPERP